MVESNSIKDKIVVQIFNYNSEVEDISDRDKQGEKGDRLLQKSEMNELVLPDILSFFN